jgi:hypothetical protein
MWKANTVCPCSGSVGNGEGVPQYGKGERLKKQRSALSKKHYNNARLKSDIGYSHPRAYSPGISRRSIPSGIGSWRRPENSGKFVGSRLHKERKG